MKNYFLWVVVLGLVFVSRGYAQTAEVRAVADIKGTAVDSKITGKVELTETSEGLKVEAHVMNVPNPGEHGFHIHEVGNCGDMGKAAGGHFNPMHVMHGMLTRDGIEHAHAGDMGNIMIGADGTGKLVVTLANVGLTHGEHNVAGLSIILHEKKDDFGQPTGNAGGRIACGIIELEK